MVILAKWDKLLLNDLLSYRWARISSELCDLSLIYVSKSKFHGEHCHDVSVNTVASTNTSFLNSYSIANVSRCRLEHCIRFGTLFLGVDTVEVVAFGHSPGSGIPIIIVATVRASNSLRT